MPFGTSQLLHSNSVYHFRSQTIVEVGDLFATEKVKLNADGESDAESDHYMLKVRLLVERIISICGNIDDEGVILMMS